MSTQFVVQLQNRPGALAAFARALAERGATLPIVFISGHGDIPTSVRAMKAGAGPIILMSMMPRPAISASSWRFRRSASSLQTASRGCTKVRRTSSEKGGSLSSLRKAISVL